MGVPRIPSDPMTKIQAAQRRIDAGIWMLFRNDDPVAIHTVAMGRIADSQGSCETERFRAPHRFHGQARKGD